MAASDYARIEKTIRYLEANFRSQPSLAEVAAQAQLSEYHFQRLFRRWAGISPKRFLQFLTAGYARQLLARAHDTLDTALASGLSGGGRLHDLMVNVYAATPGELRNSGAGLTIRYGFAPTPFGECLAARTARGICHLAFVDDGRRTAMATLGARWPQARFERDGAGIEKLVRQLFAPAAAHGHKPLALHLHGTNFQIRVWEALVRIPAGAVLSYEDLARALDAPAARRAVASAVAANSVALLIPCHRVIRKSGAFGEYRWGAPRKQAVLAWEAARTDEPEAD